MTTPSAENSASHIPIGPVLALLIVFLLGILTTQSWLDTEAIAVQFLAPATWMQMHQSLGSEMETIGETLVPRTSFLAAMGIYALAVGMTALLAWGIRRFVRRINDGRAIPQLLTAATIALCLPAVWSILEILNVVIGSTLIAQFLILIPPFLFAITFALLMTLGSEGPISPRLSTTRILSPTLLVALLVFIAISLFMNFGLYFNLRTPHGDTAMYEEHLWNFLHGKGFRSYLDQGLFLGEHIQFFHLFLIPIYILYPSHLTMEFCETLGLACGALPVYWMTRRRTGSGSAATSLAVCYLLYFPMHFLDIEIDLKSFRPEAFGIPCLLFSLDQLDRGRFWSFVGLLCLTLTVKEDYAVIVSSLGLWMFFDTLLQMWKPRLFSPLTPNVQRLTPKYRLFASLALIAFGAIYLKIALATIVWFRSGVEVHYAGYFTRFGKSTSDIIWTMLTNPMFVIQEFATWSTFLYALMLLVPLGFLPLFTLRAIAAVPIFVLLCLNEVAHDPRHHFHAPIIPLLFWAAATGGLPQAARLVGGLRAWGLGIGQNEKREIDNVATMSGAEQALQPSNEIPAASLAPSAQRLTPPLASYAMFSAWGCAMTLSLSPLSLVFWDPHSEWNYKALYIPGKRAEEFAKVLPQIPKDANVASTDYVHPRLTHFHRSYDYSNFKRKVAGDSTGVPDDTNYIVIDTQHPYSTIKSPEDVPQFREHPEQWEVLPDVTDGYYIILRKRK